MSNDVRRKKKGKDLVTLTVVLILFLIGASEVLGVVWLGVIGSILVLLQYVYYSRIIKRKKREKFLLEENIKELDGEIEKDSNERIKIFKTLKEFVNDNVDDVESILLYRYYKDSDSEEAGIMLIYEDYYCFENSNINEIIKEYYDIVLREYSKLNETEIHFIGATDERAYVSFRTSIRGKDYMVVFIILAKSSMKDEELELKVEKLKMDFLLKTTN